MLPRMELLTCAADDCNESFEPEFPGHIYHDRTCAARMRQRRRRAKLKPRPNGGPGGNRQPRLFSRSELHRRKPAKSAPRPKSGDLFPVDGQAIFATMAVGIDDDSGVLIIGRKKRPGRLAAARPEAPLAA